MVAKKISSVAFLILAAPLLMAWEPEGPLTVAGVETQSYEIGQIRAVCASHLDSPACEKMLIEQRQRFLMAWRSPVTSNMMREKMIEIISANKLPIGVDWLKAAGSYFSFVKTAGRMDILGNNPPESTISTTTTCQTNHDSRFSMYGSSGSTRTTCTTTRR